MENQENFLFVENSKEMNEDKLNLVGLKNKDFSKSEPVINASKKSLTKNFQINKKSTQTTESINSLNVVKSDVGTSINKRVENSLGLWSTFKRLKNRFKSRNEVSTLQNVQEVGREKWNRKIEFLLAIIGFSVDLGNVWRFPKVVFDNGGGRFLIPYFIQLILCGLPLFYMELILGQFHQTGILTLWEKICPILKGLALGAVFVNLLMAMFYNTIIAWSIYYLYLSFNTILPWQSCTNEWNTECCLPISMTNNQRTFEPPFFVKNNENQTIYRKIDNKLVFFELDNLNTISIESIIGSYFNASVGFGNKAIKKDFSSNLASWISSYFVISYNHDHTINVINPTDFILNDSTAYNYNFDRTIYSSNLDKYIDRKYSNYSIILNCTEFITSPTQEFFNRFLVEINKSKGLESIGGIKWQIALCLFIVFITVYFALWKGIKSAGKAVWVTAIAPYVIMFILLIRGLTLDGSENGIDFFLKINDINEIFNLNIWVEAAIQIFFSLGPGFGTIIALSSYNKISNNCYKDAMLTSFINCFTSILSGLVVFTTLGHMAKIQNKRLEDVVEGGPGLVFVTYPQAISLMPFPSFWAVIFFFMLFTLGIDSTFGGLESVITGICDAYPREIGRHRSKFVFGLVMLCFICALPTTTYGGPYLIHLLDHYAVAPSLLIIGFFEIIGVMYFYGYKQFSDDLYSMLKKRPGKFWERCWKYISPTIVFILSILTLLMQFSVGIKYDEYEYQHTGKILGTLIMVIPLSLAVLYVPYRVYKTPGTFKERLKVLTFVRYRNVSLLNEKSSNNVEIRMENIEENNITRF